MQNEGNAVAQYLKVIIAHIHAAYSDRAYRRIIEARDELYKS